MTRSESPVWRLANSSRTRSVRAERLPLTRTRSPGCVSCAEQIGRFFGGSDRRAVRQAGRARGRGDFGRAPAERDQAIDA